MAEYDAFLKRDEAPPSPQKRRSTTARAALDQQPGGERKPSVKEIIRPRARARAGKLKKGIEVQRGRAALTAAPPDPPPRVEPKRRRELLCGCWRGDYARGAGGWNGARRCVEIAQ